MMNTQPEMENESPTLTVEYDSDGEPDYTTLALDYENPLNALRYKGVMSFCRSAPEIEMELPLEEINKLTENQQFWFYNRREVEKRWLKNWPREQLSEQERYQFYGNEKRQAAAKRHKMNKGVPPSANKRSTSPPCNVLTLAKDGRSITWVGPGGVNCKGYTKVAYNERNPPRGREPRIYDDMGYPIVFDGFPDTPTKFRKRISFDRSSWERYWSVQEVIEKRENDDMEAARRKYRQQRMAGDKVYTMTTARSVATNSEESRIVQLNHDHRMGFCRTAILAGHPGVVAQGEFNLQMTSPTTEYRVARMPVRPITRSDDMFLAEITHVHSATSMYISLPPCKSALFDESLRLQGIYGDMAKREQYAVHNHKCGDMIVLRGANSLWQRACVVCKEEDERMIVYYVDTGAFERVDGGLVYACDDQFKRLPPSAVCVTVNGVDQSMAIDDDDWLRQHMTGKIVWCNILGVSSDHMSFSADLLLFLSARESHPLSDILNRKTQMMPKAVSSEIWLTEDQRLLEKEMYNLAGDPTLDMPNIAPYAQQMSRPPPPMFEQQQGYDSRSQFARRYEEQHPPMSPMYNPNIPPPPPQQYAPFQYNQQRYEHQLPPQIRPSPNPPHYAPPQFHNAPPSLQQQQQRGYYDNTFDDRPRMEEQQQYRPPPLMGSASPPSFGSMDSRFDGEPPCRESRSRQREPPTANMIKWNRVRAPSPDLSGFGGLENLVVNPAVCRTRPCLPNDMSMHRTGRFYDDGLNVMQDRNRAWNPKPCRNCRQFGHVLRECPAERRPSTRKCMFCEWRQDVKEEAMYHWPDLCPRDPNNRHLYDENGMFVAGNRRDVPTPVSIVTSSDSAQQSPSVDGSSAELADQEAFTDDTPDIVSSLSDDVGSISTCPSMPTSADSMSVAQGSVEETGADHFFDTLEQQEEVPPAMDTLRRRQGEGGNDSDTTVTSTDTVIHVKSQKAEEEEGALSCKDDGPDGEVVGSASSSDE